MFPATINDAPKLGGNAIDTAAGCSRTPPSYDFVVDLEIIQLSPRVILLVKL